MTDKGVTLVSLGRLRNGCPRTPKVAQTQYRRMFLAFCYGTAIVSGKGISTTTIASPLASTDSMRTSKV